MASTSTAVIPPPPPPPTPTTTIVHFPQRQWTTFDAKWTLTLTTTAELAWDALGSTPGSSNPGVFRSRRVAAARVVELVRAGRLWIGSGGRSVDLAMRPKIAGKAVGGGSSQGDGDEDGGDHLRELFHETILEWPIWEDKLGLRVRSSGVEIGPRDDTTLLYFTVNHPPSPSGLYAPSRAGGGIPLARLQRVSCQLDLNYCTDGFELPRPAAMTKKEKTKIKPTSRPKTKSRRGAKQSKSKKKMTPPACKSLRPQTSEAARGKQQQPVIDPRDVLVMGSPAWSQATALIKTALHVLVGTAGKAGRNKPPVPGIRPVDDVSAPLGAPSLLDVAPATWSNHYFTAVSSRAVYIPLIHRFLASFTNAQSPSLRRKAEVLTKGGVGELGQAIAQEGLLETKLEEILLKGVMQLPPRPKKPVPRPPAPSHSPVPRLARPSYLPLSPGPSQASPSDSIPSPTLVRPVYEPDNDQLVDLCYDNLEAIFSLLPDDDSSFQEQPLEWGEYTEGEDDEDEMEARELDWHDIEAWPEPNEYLDDEDGPFEDMKEGWSPEGLGCEKNEEQFEQQEGEEDPYGDVSGDDESGLALWQDMQAWQLDAWQEDGSQSMHYDVGYMDDEEIEFMDIFEEDLDEGVGLWRDENDIIEDCC